jgi:NADH:ubiquinone oxidoreductase subunit 3 (subunit A)
LATTDVAADLDQASFWSKLEPKYRTLIIIFSVQAILGILLFEFAYSRTAPYRNIDEERDCIYPAFRRNDVHNWSRWKFYPGAMLLMPFRIIILIMFMLFASLICIMMCLGDDRQSQKKARIYVDAGSTDREDQEDHEKPSC